MDNQQPQNSETPDQDIVQSNLDDKFDKDITQSIKYVLYSHYSYAEGSDLKKYREDDLEVENYEGYKYLESHINGVAGLLDASGYEGVLVLFFAPGLHAYLEGILNNRSKLKDYEDRYELLIKRLRLNLLLKLKALKSDLKEEIDPDITTKYRSCIQELKNFGENISDDISVGEIRSRIVDAKGEVLGSDNDFMGGVNNSHDVKVKEIDDKIADLKEEIKGIQELKFANEVSVRIHEKILNNKKYGLKKRVRFITSFDLGVFFERVNAVYKGKLQTSLLGPKKGIRYDTPKIVEAILRLRILGNGVPVFRLDHDVIFRGSKNRDSSDLHIFRSVAQVLRAYELRLEVPHVSTFIYSASYNTRLLQKMLELKSEDPERKEIKFEAWSRAFATRVQPALVADISKLERIYKLKSDMYLKSVLAKCKDDTLIQECTKFFEKRGVVYVDENHRKYLKKQKIKLHGLFSTHSGYKDYEKLKKITIDQSGIDELNHTVLSSNNLVEEIKAIMEHKSATDKQLCMNLGWVKDKLSRSVHTLKWKEIQKKVRSPKDRGRLKNDLKLDPESYRKIGSSPKNLNCSDELMEILQATQNDHEKDLWEEYVKDNLNEEIAREYYGLHQEEFSADFNKGIATVGAHPFYSVISGAMFCLSEGAILDLPPFSNFRNNVMWIDDHLKYSLHRAMNHFTSQTKLTLREPGFGEARLDNTMLTKQRPSLTNLVSYTLGNYLPTLLLGTIMDAWITEDPIIKNRYDALKSEDAEKWNLAREKQDKALLPRILLNSLREGHLLEAYLPKNRDLFKKKALQRINEVRDLFKDLKNDDQRTFASYWAESDAKEYFPEEWFSTLSERKNIWKGIANYDSRNEKILEWEHLNTDVAQMVTELIEDVFRYVEWTLQWPRFVQIIRSVKQGDFKGDLSWNTNHQDQ